MAHFYRGSVPAHRFLRGLLLLSMPRDRIQRAAVRGGVYLGLPPPLAALLSQFLACRPDNGGTEPGRAIQTGVLCRSVDHLQLLGFEA